MAWRLGKTFRAVASLLFFAWLALTVRPAFAGEKEDNATSAAVDKILAGDVASANFGEAKKKLKSLITQCKKACSGPTLARVHVALGMVSSQIGQADDAKTEWLEALNQDSAAALPSGTSASVKEAFEKVKKEWIASTPQPDDAQKAGWVNKAAFDLNKAAIVAEQSGNYAECIDKDKSALTLEENMRARLHLAGCEAKANKVIDALRDNSKALELARAKNDTATIKLVQERVTELLPRIAHVKFDLPTATSGVTDLKLQFDERPIPPERYSESFTIDPGTHKVHAEGYLRGARVSYDDEKLEVKDGETVQVKVTLKPAALTQGQLQCMVTAKTQEEIQACLPSDKKPLAIHAALDFSGYGDTLAVRVVTPAVKASVASPTAGWNVGASYLIDVVSAASPDLVASASTRFQDVRHAVTANGGFKPGQFGGNIYGDVSIEHDYTSRTIGGSANVDLLDKAFTPTVGVAYSWDTIGRTGVSYDIYSKKLTTLELSAGATSIMSPVSLIVFGAEVALESGDQSKPYRYVPLFEAGVSPPAGASADQVNAQRLPAKPLEQLPTNRKRFSFGARYIRRMNATSTLRLEERLYGDTWGTKATTTDGQYLIDLSPRLRVWPHGHLHGQTAATFFQRVYGATLNSDGSATIPQYRSTDRELGMMIGVTGGGGARVLATDPNGKIQLAFYATGDALFNYYFNSLYLHSRLGFYGTIGIEADFE